MTTTTATIKPAAIKPMKTEAQRLVGQLAELNARKIDLVDDLNRVTARTDAQWVADRINELAWCNKVVARIAGRLAELAA